MPDTGLLSADQIERTLRWALIEYGTAGLSDCIASAVLAQSAPTVVFPASAAVAGQVVLMHRARAESAGQAQSSFEALRAAVRPGTVILVHCEPDVGSAFGSNLALHAATMRAQAIMSDGPFRDTVRLMQTGIVCGGTGTQARKPAGAAMVQVESQMLFGTDWQAGDWLLRDADAVIRLTPDVAERAAHELAGPGAPELDALLGRG